MKILLLDDCFVYDSSDPFLVGLSRWGEYVFYEKQDEAGQEAIRQEAEILLTNQACVTRSLIASMPSLRYIGVMATGYNHIDVEAARERNIVVCNVPAYSGESVAQGVFAHILNIFNRIHEIDAQIRRGIWLDFGQEAYWKNPVWGLYGKTLGIVGLGNIGMTVARIGSAGFGMEVKALTSRKAEDLPYGIQPVSQEELFAVSDVLTLHCPLNDATRHMVNADSLRNMKPTAVLINAGRGGLVDESALYDALVSGRLAAAGLDVLDREPPLPDNPLLSLPNCFFTAHNCWATPETREKLLHRCLENIEAFLNGKALNRV